jgi:hypothetical protein
MNFLRPTAVPRRGVLAALLVLLLLRAWVPVGFMPAPGQAFRLQLCQAGETSAVSHVLAPLTDRRSNGHGHGDSCPFGSSPAAAPIPELPALASGVTRADAVVIAENVEPIVSLLLRAQRARGPPALV